MSAQHHTPTASELKLTVVSSLASVSQVQWDALVAQTGGNVFLSHAYLHALHETGCASADTGWHPQYILAYGTANDRTDVLLGALPLYLKSHSYGEYVFDWAWADAWQRAGGEYYPKLLSAVPFTPCSGPRLLASQPTVATALIEAALSLAQQLGVSSLHVLFPPESEAKQWQAANLMRREGVQFHWRNTGFSHFDDMLSAMSHDKRKRIRQDRRYVHEAGISWRALRGSEIDDSAWRFFYACYERTYLEHGNAPYLNLAFFQRIGTALANAPVLFIGERDGEPLCASLCIACDKTLYGRYWGSLAAEPIRSLHFEACYYQPLAWCIAHGFQVFEGGAQGAHKLARGLLPTPTRSLHWLADSHFADAVDRFLQRERVGVQHTLDELNEHSPFREGPARKD